MFGFTDYSEYRRNEQEITRRNEQKRRERELRETRGTRETGRGTDRRAAAARPARARWA
ncbi:hypothetical protein [Myceligenerans pegani]|uniref:Uncharacterized protein n=1 Tax=Myceligenerans pegani TaxID=2776917 RepID=A0ABR9N3X4_9MICO|nr:hypothetical protein [Myceligenerans sp. TRM 65318]MBE1877778.1 hypothetical protein [Myceligenerans sp. TRM 65318]MBE3020049.1 hypothetical protein [Myceligenerans sp. TRM 65318]